MAGVRLPLQLDLFLPRAFGLAEGLGLACEMRRVALRFHCGVHGLPPLPEITGSIAAVYSQLLIVALWIKPAGGWLPLSQCA